MTTVVQRIELRDSNDATAAAVNVYLVGETHTLLIDAGYSGRANRQLIQAAFDRRPFDRLLLTHAHRDHSEAAPALQSLFDLTIYRHPDERVPVRRTALRDLVDGDVMACGADGGRLRVLHTPGHTSGHCAFYVELEQALFAGDLIFASGHTWIGPPRGDLSRYLDSLRRVAALPLCVIYPSHGQPIREPAARIDEEIRYRLEREQEILRLLQRAPQRAEELVAALHPTVSLRRLPFACLNLRGYLDRLCALGQVRLDADGRYRHLG